MVPTSPKSAMKFNLALFVGIVSVLATANASVLLPRVGAKLTQAQAEAQLKKAGIKWTSSGGCSTKSNPKCTSFSGVIDNTINKAVELKGACDCEIVITGGTEAGHPGGTYSHANGYMLNFRKTSGLNSYIHNTFERISNGADGEPRYRAKSGNVYQDEGTNWDVVFYIAV